MGHIVTQVGYQTTTGLNQTYADLPWPNVGQQTHAGLGVT